MKFYAIGCKSTSGDLIPQKSNKLSIPYRVIKLKSDLIVKKPRSWKRENSIGVNCSQFKRFAKKYIAFYRYYKCYVIITMMAALVAGILIGVSLSSILAHLDRNKNAYKKAHRQVLTIEALEQKTTMVIRLDDTVDATSVANAYILSETRATDQEIKGMRYTALSHTESLTEYLVMRAIDSPQHYVYRYAYGISVESDDNGLNVQARYSPLHHDQSAAARSLARVYMALLRHYTQALDASIQVTDDPLTLDLTPWMRYASKPPLVIQFILILTISHITLLPSMEHGLVRHFQCNAMNFSPARYWLFMFGCDLMMYWCQVCIMTLALVMVVHLSVPLLEFSYQDLAIVPVLLLVYGFGCIPQAYLFSIGPRTALNSMTFVIVNVVFGETTVIAKLFYGEALYYALYFMRLSPQFNMAYAYVKMKQIFLYNNECVFFKSRNLCNTTILHKCCGKCGVLQECYERKPYFTRIPGILGEIYAIIGTAVLFTIFLLLWEYRVLQRLYRHLIIKTMTSNSANQESAEESIGLKQEKDDVRNKLQHIKYKREKVDTFGEYLLADNLAKKENGYYQIRNISFGIGKGEVLALSGLKRHGRAKLCEILAGYKIPTTGDLWSMSKWKLKPQPYKYTRNISISCERRPLQRWMKVYDALALLASLRGVPQKNLAAELTNYIQALDLEKEVNKYVGELSPNDSKRLHFAAAVVGAPPVLIIDECTAYQMYSVRRAIYYILYTLKKRGHAIFVSSSNVESHLPISNRLAILVDGYIYDVDQVDRLVARYSNRGYTVVVHLKDELNVGEMFSKHFHEVIINDSSDVLVNVQVLDQHLDWGQIFEKMEELLAQNPQYTRNISISCERRPLQRWMKVYDALALLASLRGVPQKNLAAELTNYIQAIDLEKEVNKYVGELSPNDSKRLHFAAAVVGAPPVLIIDECTAYQMYSVRRAIYYILYTLKKRGHAIFVSSSNVESHLPISNRLAILVDGYIYDVDQVDRLVARYSNRGYTVVVHLKDELNVGEMFSKHFHEVIINDSSDVLVNVQVLDQHLDWGQIFEKMEELLAQNPQVYSYIVSAIPIDYIYNTIVANEHGLRPADDLISMVCLRNLFAQRVLIEPKKEVLDQLTPFETKYSITRLKELPWSVIFHR